jgi:hypothetical protein
MGRRGPGIGEGRPSLDGHAAPAKRGDGYAPGRLPGRNRPPALTALRDLQET